ncbi:unnamed protein product [Blepharisma stoltei]|uniref:RGS domain-containing protein n=1 Tax=Blepharisma stoltei TaxID=1481888 RepID=A0AAU9JYU0_9CILI|nr:unnamed protein product [Blepharisma stoltei]
MTGTWLYLVWLSIFITIFGIYSFCLWYIFHRRDFQEIYSRSAGILLFSIIVNGTENIGSISLGFIEILGLYYNLKVCTWIFVIYEISHNAYFISNVLRMYRLVLLNRIRNGNYCSYLDYLNSKKRLGNQWNIKIILAYSLPISAFYIAFALYQMITKTGGALNMIFDISWNFLILFEDACYLIFLLKIRKIPYYCNLKAELYLILVIWSMGLTAPFVSPLFFHFYIIPSKNLCMLINTFFFLQRSTKRLSIVPLEVLKSPRVLLEDQLAFNYFVSFAKKSKNKHWEYYLKILVEIHLFKLDPNPEKAYDIYSNFLAGKNNFAESMTLDLSNQSLCGDMNPDISASMFNDVENNIFKQFNETVYPEFQKSQEYQELLRESTHAIY